MTLDFIISELKKNTSTTPRKQLKTKVKNTPITHFVILYNAQQAELYWGYYRWLATDAACIANRNVGN